MLTRDIGGTCRSCAPNIGAFPSFYEPSARIGAHRTDTFQHNARIGKYDETEEISGWLDKFRKTEGSSEIGWPQYAALGLVAVTIWWVLQ